MDKLLTVNLSRDSRDNLLELQNDLEDFDIRPTARVQIRLE
jgi:hypothetical protein